MPTPIKRTFSTTYEQAIAGRNWHIVDVSGINIGRAATQIAHLLRGKHKPTYTPNVDCGDFVIVLNAQKVAFSGNKLDDMQEGASGRLDESETARKAPRDGPQGRRTTVSGQ